MSLEAVLVVVYLLGCIALGVWASRRGLASQDEYWVAGRRIGKAANAMAIMAGLASGGSILGVMGMAYQSGIPYTLALFAGAVVGFPLAAVLVAAPLRRFGRFTITDFLAWRYPGRGLRILVPLAILFSFTIYITAQLKAAGITAEVLLGVPYPTAVTVSTVVFILYVSIGGMLAVTWTDIVQGTLMLLVVAGTAVALTLEAGAPAEILRRAAVEAPGLGAMTDTPMVSLLGVFVLWVVAVPVIPHVVMRVFTARDAHGARISLNLAMVLYSAMVLMAVFLIVPVGRLAFPDLADADQIFLHVMQTRFPPVVRGLAIAAVLAAVMSTTDALLLACSAAVTHDLLGRRLARARPAVARWTTVGVTWVIGLSAMCFAYDPPRLITTFYSAAIGLLGAGFFVPLVAGLWWKRANGLGGLLSAVAGGGTYLWVQYGTAAPPFSAVLFGLGAGLAGMVAGAVLGPAPAPELVAAVGRLHEDDPRVGPGPT